MSVDEWTEIYAYRIFRYIQCYNVPLRTVESRSAVTRWEILPFVTTWVHLEALCSVKYARERKMVTARGHLPAES